MSARVGIAILAAGCSQRLGQPKQLVLWQGEPLVRRAVQAAGASTCDAVAVVVGAHADLVAHALTRGPAATLVQNPSWSEGIGSSVRAAAGWARATGLDALVLAVCDQPRLSTAHLDALIRAHRRRGGPVASIYAGVRGVPALLPASAFARLALLRGDRGAGTLLRRLSDVVEIEWEDGAFDVDTPEDLRAVAVG